MTFAQHPPVSKESLMTTQDIITKTFNALYESVASIVIDPVVDKSQALAQTMQQAETYVLDKLLAEPEEETFAKVEAENAYEQLMQKAAEVRKLDPNLSASQAFARAYEAPHNRELAKAERAERRAVVQKGAGDRLVAAAARIREHHPAISMEDAIATARKRNRELDAQFTREQSASHGPVTKAPSGALGSRVHALAAAVARQHPGMSHDECVHAVLNRNPALAVAWQREQATA
jgi:hypothetical protein